MATSTASAISVPSFLLFEKHDQFSWKARASITGNTRREKARDSGGKGYSLGPKMKEN
jgi:hypothetical protein